MTHPDSKFTAFTLTLPNGGQLTGIQHLPSAASSAPPPFKPLMVGIHGGACTCHTYDVDARHTASLTSAGLEIPFVAFNRPNYEDTTSFLPLKEGTTYLQEEAKWWHEQILPTLWTEFGKPNHCTGIVTICHSMAVPGMIITAATHAQDPSPKYPLAGIILSGYGTRRHDRMVELAPPGHPPPSGREVDFPPGVMQILMLSDPSLKCYDPAVLKQIPVQIKRMMTDELIDLVALWFTYWRQYSDNVRVPVLYALGEHDWLWEGNDDPVKEFMAAFPKSERVEGGVVLGAPHALEWWWGSQGWYARCFGWGVEVCTNMGLKQDIQSAETST